MFRGEVVFWSGIGLMLFLAMLFVASLSGCATVEVAPLCSTDARPMSPRVELRFVGMEYEVKCYSSTGQSSCAKLKIRSSEWIWTALSAAVAALATAVVADRDGASSPGKVPEGLGVDRSIDLAHARAPVLQTAPPLTPAEASMPMLEHAGGLWADTRWSFQWSALQCGGPLAPAWCP